MATHVDTTAGESPAVPKLAEALLAMVGAFGHRAQSPVERRAVWTAVDAFKAEGHPAGAKIEAELIARGQARR